ncbi:MAG: hypothetical protein WCG07_01580 [Candidatus Taylorbacteria bacterium]
MNKPDKIKEWLKNNSEKTEDEIEKYLLSEITQLKDSDFTESWQRHYFMENLKSRSNNFSPKIIRAINHIRGKTDDVPMLPKRYLALIVDLAVLAFINYLLQIVGVSSDNLFIDISLYLIYFCFSLYWFKTTIGLYLFKIQINFKNSNFLLGKLILRELIWFTAYSGIGLLVYLVYGPYWDRIVGAYAININK